MRSFKLAGWLIGMALAYSCSLSKYYIILSAFYLIWNNLGQAKPGQVSAYSVFNNDGKRLAGTFQGKQMMGTQGASSTKNIVTMQSEPSESAEFYWSHASKMANRECYCGSGRKYKKCCLGKKEEDNKSQ